MNAMFKIPADAKFLMFPIAFACCAMATMVTKILTKDPETQGRVGMDYYETEAVQTTAKAYWHENPVRGFFHERMKGHKTVGVFNNEFEAKN